MPLPSVWDTGSSLGLIHCRAIFLDYVDVKIPIKNVTKMNFLVGIGKFQNDKGEEVFLPYIAYHIMESYGLTPRSRKRRKSSDNNGEEIYSDEGQKELVRL